MWQPKYTITNKMLHSIRQIGEVIGIIKSTQFTTSNLVKLQHSARELSTFASTSIEGNPLPLTDVKRILQHTPTHIRDTEKEVLNYNQALIYLDKQVKDKNFMLSHQTITHIQGLVVDGLMENTADIGRYRQRHVVIRNPKSIDDIVFMPPDYKDVQTLMDNLLNFINANLGKIDSILLAGLFHRQHVIIHPFMDGNGRTTRLLTTALLGDQGFDLFDIFSLENYYNQNISKYFSAVGAIGDYYELADNMDFTLWLEYFTDGILDELKRVEKTLPQFTQPYRLEKHHKQILAFIDHNGSITQREYATISSRSLASRKNDFKYLLERDLIAVHGKGKASYYVKKN